MGPSFPYPPNIDAIVETFENPRNTLPDAVYPVTLDCVIYGNPNVFWATPNDVMDYGRDIYARVVAGEWGPIGPYVPPVPQPLTQAELLAYSNVVIGNYKSIARSYVLDVTTTIKSDIIDTTTAEINSLVIAGTANPSATTLWVDNFGVTTVITGAEAIILGSLTTQYRNSLYAVLSQGTTGINNGTITTTGQIDNLPWPT